MRIARARSDALDDLVVDTFMDENPRAGRADLAGIEEYPGRGRGRAHRGVEIGIWKDDVRRLAAKLQRDTL